MSCWSIASDGDDGAFLSVVAVPLDLLEIVAEKAEDRGRRFGGAGRVDVAGQIRIGDARRKAVHVLFLDRRAARLAAVVGSLIQRDLGETSVGAVNHPA